MYDVPSVWASGSVEGAASMIRRSKRSGVAIAGTPAHSLDAIRQPSARSAGSRSTGKENQRRDVGYPTGFCAVGIMLHHHTPCH